MLSALGRSVLEQSTEASASPGSASKPVRFRLVRKDGKNGSAHNTPAKDTTTPAPSVRIRRVGLQGAPVRRGKRTPQSDEGYGSNLDHLRDHEHEPQSQEREKQPPSQDQENLPVSVPLAQVSANTPLRPAPPPPKMSMLEAATKAAGASTTRKKTSRRPPFIVNGKTFHALERCGKGGSAEVWRVQAENGKPFALKRVRLQGQDPSAIQGYKGEIDLLNKLKGVPRVVELFDYMVDDEKEILYVVSLLQAVSHVRLAN